MSTAMNKPHIHPATSATLLAEELGAEVIRVLSDAIEQRGAAYLVVSGGSTPRPLFQYLSKQPIDWSKVSVLLADERCVEPGNHLSNARLVKQELLQGHASGARFISLFDGGIAHTDDQSAAGLKLLGLPAYDMVILGMGDDGHTASIFPQAANRDLALELNSHKLAFLTDPVTVSPMRITQSASRLLNTRNLVVHFTGAGKAELFNRILANPDQTTWPISAFVSQNLVPLQVFTDVPNLEGVTA